MIDTFNGALTLKATLFESMRSSPQAVRQGLTLVLLVGLLVGSFQAISAMITNANVDRITTEIETALEETIKQQSVTATSPEQREMLRLIAENKSAIVALVKKVVELPTLTPRPVGLLFRGVGQAVSTPLNYLGSLVVAVIFTHLAARQMGGEGNIQQMLGVGALSVAPHALDALGFIPTIGSTFTMIAWVWGLIILITATSVVHRLDSSRATLAVILYPLVASLIFLLSCCLFGLLSMALGV